MSSTTTPSWTDSVSIIAAAVLARGSTSRGTLDLRAKHGARIFAKIGRGGTAALTTGVNFLCRPILNDDTAIAGHIHPENINLVGGTVAANSTTVSGTNVAAGDVEIHTAAVTGLAVADDVCIQDSGGGVTRLEWGRIAKLTVASGTGITLDRPCAFAHTTAQADTVRQKSDIFVPFWIDGGALYECIFDYSSQSTGDSITIHCMAQTLDSYTST